MPIALIAHISSLDPETLEQNPLIMYALAEYTPIEPDSTFAASDLFNACINFVSAFDTLMNREPMNEIHRHYYTHFVRDHYATKSLVNVPSPIFE